MSKEIVIFFEQVSEGFYSNEGSVNLKFQIMMRHVELKNWLDLIFGGTFDTQFDAEYGSWLGAGGLLVLIGLTAIYFLYWYSNPLLRPFIVTFAFMGISSTILYGLATASLVFLILIIVASKNNQK